MSYTVKIDDDLDYFEGPASGPPADHAATHVTGGGDTIADAIAAGNSGLLSGADKTKLDGIAAGAEVNVNADWNSVTGDSEILNKPSTMAPTDHAADHVTGGGDIIANAISAGNSGLMSGADKAILDELNLIPPAMKEPTGFEDATLITVAYDSTARTVTLTQTGGIAYWWRGAREVLTSPWVSTAHTDAVGSYFLSSSDGVTFSWSSSPWSFSDIQVAYVLKNAAFGTLCIRETHGMTQDSVTHDALHNTVGTRKVSGGALTSGTYLVDGTTDADNTPGIDGITLADEDNVVTLSALTQGTYQNARLVSTTLTITTDSFPFRVGVTYPYINTSGTDVETVTGRFFNVWCFAVPASSDAGSQALRWFFLQPQRVYNSLNAAQQEQQTELSLGNLTSLLTEFFCATKITYGTLASYGTTGKCRIRAVTYLTVSRVGTSGASTLVAHASTHVTGGSDTIADAVAAGNSGLLSGEDKTRLDGLTIASSPVFATVKLSDLTDGYIPYHVSDAAGLADGPLKADVDSAVSLKHSAGSDFLVMQVFS